MRLAAQGAVEMQSPEGYIFQIAANLLRDRSRRDRVRNAYRAEVAQVEGRGIDLLDPLRIVGDREALSSRASPACCRYGSRIAAESGRSCAGRKARRGLIALKL